MSPAAELDTVSIAELEAEAIPGVEGATVTVTATMADGVRREILFFRVDYTGAVVHGTTHTRADAMRIGRPA